MNKDRGTIKWTAMMLPEHVKLLREWQHEDRRHEKPQLDEAQLEQMNEKIMRAYEQQSTLQIMTWQNYEFQTYRGAIKAINTYAHQLRLDSGQTISFDCICDVVLDSEW